MLDEPGKDVWKRRIDLSGINPPGNGKQDICAAAGSVAARAIRVGRLKPMEDPGAMQEVVDQGIDDDDRRTNGEPVGPSRSSPDQQPRQRHADGLVGDPIDTLQRADEGRPGCCYVGGMGCYLSVNPPNNVPISYIPDKQKQAVRSLIQATVPEPMAGQGTGGKLVRRGARLLPFPIAAAGECPISVELATPRMGGEGIRNLGPGHVAVAIDIPRGDGVRDSLET